MIFGKGSKKDVKFLFNAQKLESVTEFNYLGLTLTPQVSFAHHLEKTLKSAKMAISVIWSQFFARNEINFDIKLKVFEAVSRTVLCYASQIWGYAFYEPVEKLQKFFIKKILKLPQCTPDYMI